jgi:sugar phosphate isomerase/epimerase
MAERKYGFVAALGFRQWQPEEVLSCLHDLGYRAVSWPLEWFDPRLRARNALSDLVELTQKHGMEIAELGIQQDLVEGDDATRQGRIDMMTTIIRRAGELGVPNLNVYTGPQPWNPKAPQLGTGIPEGRAWGRVEAAFAQLLPVAEKAGVFLCIESVFGHVARDYYTTRELFNRCPSPALAINMDPSHYALERNDIPWTVRQWGERIRHVHLKDAAGRAGVHQQDFVFPLLGEGLVDWTAFVDALDSVGYAGFLTVEFESFHYYSTVLGNDPARAAAISMEQIRALMGEE